MTQSHFTHMLSRATDFSLGYSVAVGEFTGDTEQGEGANDLLRQTARTHRPSSPSKRKLQKRHFSSVWNTECLKSPLSPKGCWEPCEGSDRVKRYGVDCPVAVGLDSVAVMRTVSVCLGHDPDGDWTLAITDKGISCPLLWLIRMISGRLHRALQDQRSASRFSSGFQTCLELPIETLI